MLQTPAGYYDRFPNHLDWKKVLFNPGFPVMAAEVIEMQSIGTYQFSLLAQSLFKDGTYLSGGEITITQLTDDDPQTTNLGQLVSINPGQLYALGYVHDVPAGSVEITGIGYETISLLISENVITVVQDSDLNDPAIGAENYGLPGADRLTFSYEFLLNSPLGIVIATFLDGQLLTQSNTSNWLNQLLAILAQRTYEQLGSFLTTRPTLEIVDLASPDSNPLQLGCNVTGGVGYIQGYRRTNQKARLPIGRTLDSAIQLNEPITYLNGTLVYPVNNTPVSAVQSILATVQSPAIPMIRGSVVNGQDAVPSQFLPMAAIVSVVQGIVTFTQGVDYVRSGNFIHWIGSQPATGTSYTAVVQYTTLLNKAVRTLQTVTNEPRTVTSASTALVNADVQAVASIKRVSDNYIYVSGVDYTVALHTGIINWIIVPTNPTNITVTYTYWNHTTEGDFVSRDSFVSTNGILQNYITPTKTPTGVTVDYLSQISFDVVGGDTPVDTSSVFISYPYYVSRVDVLGWRVDGILEIIRGVPSQRPVAQILDASVMPIAEIMIPPEAFAASVTIKFANNLTMFATELRRMFDQVLDLQFDVAQFQLYQNMQNITTATDKRGIFADNLATPFLADVNNPLFGGTFDFIARTFSLPRTGGTVSPPPVITNGTGAVLKQDMWFVDYTETSTINQPYASLATVINQFASVNLSGQLSLTPPADISVNINQTVKGAGVGSVALVQTSIQNALALVYTQVGSTVSQVLQENYNTAPNSILNQVPLEELNAFSSAPVNAQMTVANSFSRVTTNIQVNLAQEVNQSIIRIDASGFRASDRAISVSFDGIVVPLTPISPTVSDPNTSLYSGCVIASPTGTWSATFQIPPNISSGVHVIEAFGHDATDDTIITSFATTNYLVATFVEDITTIITELTQPPPKAQTTCQIPLYAMASSIKIGLPTTRAIAAVKGPMSVLIATLFADATIANAAIPGLAFSTGFQAIVWPPYIVMIIRTTFGHAGTNPKHSRDMYDILTANPLDIAGNAAKIEALSTIFKKTLCSIATGVLDPLAETFQLSQDSFVTSVDLFFSVAPVSETVTVFICQTEVGIPDSSHPLASVTLPAGSINTGLNTLTKFTFAKPIFLQGGVEYAFVVTTEDTLAALYTAVLGQKDIGSQALITGSPASGAMLQSPNNSSWQLLAGRQLKFNLNTALFNTPTATLNLGQVTFAQPSSRFSLLVPFGLPEKNSSVIYQYSLDNQTWINFPPLVEVDLNSAVTVIYLRILMAGNNFQCPTVANLSQLSAFIWNASGSYVHRQFVLPQADSTIVDLYVDTYIPGNTSLTPYVSYDGFATSNPMTEVVADAVQISDTMFTRHYTWNNGIQNEQNIQTRIDLASTVNFVTPFIQNYRVIAR